jgi:hypothetical protein
VQLASLLVASQSSLPRSVASTHPADRPGIRIAHLVGVLVPGDPVAALPALAARTPTALLLRAE